jgi:hypothetical protein
MNYRAEVSIPRPGDVDPRTIVEPTGPTFHNGRHTNEQAPTTEALMGLLRAELDRKYMEKGIPQTIEPTAATLRMDAPDRSSVVLDWESGRKFGIRLRRENGTVTFGEVELDEENHADPHLNTGILTPSGRARSPIIDDALEIMTKPDVITSATITLSLD